MNRRLNVGLVGVGRLGIRYVEYLFGIRKAQLKAIADIEQTALKRVTREFDIPYFYSDYRDLIANKEIDAVVIAASTKAHKEIILAAADAGKATFCEKPLALSLEDAQQVKNVVEAKGLFFHMGFMRRFDRGYAAARQQVEAGEIGQPILFRATSRDPYPPDLDYLRGSGGIFLDLGIHDFDLARWFMGAVTSVFSHGNVLAYPEIKTVGDVDNAVISLTFQNQTLGAVDLSRSGVYGYDIRAEILGTKGTIQVGYLRQTPIVVLKENRASFDTVPFFMERFERAFIAQLRDFVEKVWQESEPSITCTDGLEALRIAEAAKHSLREKRPVNLAELP